MTTIGDHCARDLHQFCREDGTGCACPACHLGPCASCGATNLCRLFTTPAGEVCATCYRDWAHTRPAPQTPCDRCGTPPAVRDPSKRRNEYLCAQCHAADGHVLSVSPSAGNALASCHGRDEADPGHEWRHIRGRRYACRRCQARKLEGGTTTRRYHSRKDGLRT